MVYLSVWIIDALDLLGHRTRFDEFVIASGDSDFMPLLQRIRAEDRRTTIVSPGYLAAAYSASADRVVDFDALRELLRSRDADAVLKPPVGTVAQTDGVDYGSIDFADFVRRRYLEAVAPLAMGKHPGRAALLCGKQLRRAVIYLSTLYVRMS
ncbi:hypothetical protein ASE90_16645 [Sphingomonas sp. Leaf67]|uniref:NYN domain-containing protein n=1 Tax=Sphingomonas sp. Leaf67 TaxID=1736230 RepID=UPI0006FF58F0|nr:NYN domain-containing protein [Sphingomonas sp. Leaf67]KQN90731.1 hypothetical protein ASE90_16645 [Sphingomonas sp. Leaf67]